MTLRITLTLAALISVAMAMAMAACGNETPPTATALATATPAPATPESTAPGPMQPTPTLAPTPAPTPAPEPATTSTPAPQPMPTATPTPTPGLPSPITDLKYGARLERNQPARAAQLTQLPWVADGLDVSEWLSAEDLIKVALEYPDVFDVLMEMSWIQDDNVTRDEAKATEQILLSAYSSTAMTKQMSQKPWVLDGITATEANAMFDLARAIGEAPALAERLLVLSWVEDGITADEAETIRHLRRVEEKAPTLAVRMLVLSWTHDGITADEAKVIEYLRRAAEAAPALAERILQKPWVQDGIIRDEVIIILRLGWLAERTDEATQQSMADVAISIIDMPFLDDVTLTEALAVMSLHQLTSISTRESFRAVMSHPKVQDGITDQEAKVIAVLATPARREPEMIPIMLDGLDGTGGVYLEERAIQLPLTGETLLTIVRTQDQTTASMDYLEHAVRFAEKFMAAPLPTNYVALYFGPNTRQNYTAHNWTTHIAMGSDRDGPERKANVFAHEVGHYYFRSPGPRWIHEGAAEIITFVSEYERAGYPLETHLNPPCDNINTLPASDPDEHKLCAYYLGGSFFIDLYRTLGEDAFLRGFRALYRLRLVDTPDDDCFECTELNVRYVEAAFKESASAEVAAKVDEVLARWYYGTAPQPTPAATPAPTPDARLSFPWLDDGVSEDERRAVNFLREILREAPAVAETLLGFPWLADGVTEDESYAVYHLREILREAPAVAETLLGFHWLADGVTGDERNAVYDLRVILQEAPATAETLLGFQWFADGVNEDESQAVYNLQEIFLEKPAAAKTLLSFPWLADGVTQDESDAVYYLRVILQEDPAAAESLLSSPWFADGITEDELQTLRGQS